MRGPVHRMKEFLRKLLARIRERGILGVARLALERLRARPQAETKPVSPGLTVEAALRFYRERERRARRRRPDESFPQVSVLVLTYNNLPMSQACLHSIYCNTTYPNFEVVVVDNASSDGTPQWLSSFAAAHDNLKLILNEENQGFAAGNNQGARASTGDYLVFLNNDTLVTPGWVERLLAYLQSDPEIGLVGPVTNSTGNEARIPVDYNSAAEMEAFSERLAHTMSGQCFEIRSLALYCTMARKDQFISMGGLDERFGVGMFEDEDLAVRYQAAGLRVVCAEDVFIHHFWRAAFSKMDKDRYDRLFAENRRKFEEKWGREWQPYKRREPAAPRPPAGTA